MYRKALLAALLVSAPFAANAQVAARTDIPEVLRRPIRQGISQEGYLSQVMTPFRAMLQGKSQIDLAGVRLQREIQTKQAEQASVAQIIIYDTNGDGKVTPQEIKEGLAIRRGGNEEGAQANMAPAIERQVEAYMTADTNKDGVLDILEMRAYGTKRGMGGMYAGLMQGVDPESYFTLVPEGASLSAAELFKRAQSVFVGADTNGDTILSREEAEAAAPGNTRRGF